MGLLAAVHRSRLAHDCVRCDAPFRTRLDNNGQTSILARDGYDVNDPKRSSRQADRTCQPPRSMSAFGVKADMPRHSDAP